MLDEDNINGEEPAVWTTVVLGFWIILLLPWILLALMSGMAFDAGYTVEAYTTVACILTYPITVLTAGILRKKKAILVLLPCLNFLVMGLVSAIAHNRL